MPFSQIIPPSPSPTESERLFYTSVSLLLSRIQGYCYHLSKFRIYGLIYSICFSLTYFPLYNRLVSSTSLELTQMHSFLWLSNIPLCIYVPQLYPFICQLTSRLLPCPNYCKPCCNELWVTRVSFNSGFLSVCAQQWDCCVVWQFCSQFLKESPHCSP